MRQIITFFSVLGVFLFVACHNSESPDVIVLSEGDSPKQDSSLWKTLADKGVAEFFTDEFSEGFFSFDFSSEYREPCTERGALQNDNHTIYYEKLDAIYREGSLVDGICGKALRLKDGEVAPLRVPMSDSLSVGTVEFLFRPGEDFYEKDARTLLGDDKARIHFFYRKGVLYFQKNHADVHYYVGDYVEFDKGWNHIAGQWGDGFMSLWVNDVLVAAKYHEKGYVPAVAGDPFENMVLIGFKSSCCMEGPDYKESLTTSGDFDQFRISDIPRYEIGEDSDPDTVDIDSRETDHVDSASGDTIPVDVHPADTIPVDSSTSPSLKVLWNIFNTQGIASFFDTSDLPKVSKRQGSCEAPALAEDDKTLFMDELETVYLEGKLVDGVCGKALLLKDGQVAPLGIDLSDSIEAGTVEFWFRPGEDFKNKSERTLLGNDNSRIHFLFVNGQLVFQKNHDNKHIFVQDSVDFKDGWNLIAGQWGDGYISLWLNGKEVARREQSLGYAPGRSRGKLDNLIVIGYKSGCCMEGVGVNSALTTSGAYDQVRISNVPRYERALDAISADSDSD